MMGWLVAGLVALYALYLARILSEAQRELHIEKRLRWQAEQREEHSEATRRRVAALNWELAKKSPMYFNGEPYYEWVDGGDE